jgi:hypothetical protein
MISQSYVQHIIIKFLSYAAMFLQLIIGLIGVFCLCSETVKPYDTECEN